MCSFEKSSRIMMAVESPQKPDSLSPREMSHPSPSPVAFPGLRHLDQKGVGVGVGMPLP